MYTYRTLVRDALVGNAGIKTVFGATNTGSCWVNMENLRTTAKYPGIIIGWAGGETTPGMDADEGRIYTTIECKGTGSTHAHKELGKIRSAIINVIDDTYLSATAVCYHLRKFSEVDGFDNDKKIWWLRLGFAGQFKQNVARP